MRCGVIFIHSDIFLVLFSTSALSAHTYAIPRSHLANIPTHWILLRPPAQRRRVVAPTELVQPGGGIEVATGYLPGIAHCLRRTNQISIQVVLIYVYYVVCFYGKAHDKTTY